MRRSPNRSASFARPAATFASAILNWHICFICGKASEFNCYCCPKSVCGCCVANAEFTLKNGKKGLCTGCLKLTILVEENVDVTSDRQKVDFLDKQTEQFLFKEYWELVKKKEGLTLGELHTDNICLKRKENKVSASEQIADEYLEEDLVTSNKRSRSRTKKYISWGPAVILEEDDNAEKRQRVTPDSKVKSELNHCRRNVSGQPISGRAAIVEQNINAVYLRKSLVLKLMKDSETFESKIVGCFVRVKCDANDFRLFRKDCRIGQIKGVKKVPDVYKVKGTSIDVALCITDMMDVQIDRLSDDDIKKDECEDLCQMVKKGAFKMPTIAALDKKIKSMHHDIMNHWIDIELSALTRRIDDANLKGWRAQFDYYYEKRRLLNTQEERERLLAELPDVIADEATKQQKLSESTRVEMEVDALHSLERTDTKQPNPQDTSGLNNLSAQIAVDHPVNTVDSQIEIIDLDDSDDDGNYGTGSIIHLVENEDAIPEMAQV